MAILTVIILSVVFGIAVGYVFPDLSTLQSAILILALFYPTLLFHYIVDKKKKEKDE